MNTKTITQNAIELAKIMKAMEKEKPGSAKWVQLSAKAAKLMK